MGLTLADTYYLKAKGAMSGWCSEWDEVCEALNYALSYDENHCPSLCLLGQVYIEYLHMPEKGFEYLDRAIAINPDFIEVYPLYIKYLIWNDELDRASKLVSYAKTITAIDKAQLRWLSSYIQEKLGNYKTCFEELKEAKRHCFNLGYFNFMDDEKKRIQKKMDLDNPKPKKRKKTKKANS